MWGRGRLSSLQVWADKRAWTRFAFAFLMFGIKQAYACLFGGAMLFLILVTFLVWPDQALVSRYDFLVVGAVILQVLMLGLKLETWAEAQITAPVASSSERQRLRREARRREATS